MLVIPNGNGNQPRCHDEGEKQRKAFITSCCLARFHKARRLFRKRTRHYNEATWVSSSRFTEMACKILVAIVKRTLAMPRKLLYAVSRQASTRPRDNAMLTLVKTGIPIHVVNFVAAIPLENRILSRVDNWTELGK